MLRLVRTSLIDEEGHRILFDDSFLHLQSLARTTPVPLKNHSWGSKIGLKPAAMVGWSGAGSLEDLEVTLVRKLRRPRIHTKRIANTFVLDADDPVMVARRASFLPGVAWISVGYTFQGVEAYLKNLEHLAGHYIGEGKTFRVSAHAVNSEKSAGDLVLAGNSGVLSSVKGSRVSERRPDVRFHVSMDGEKGACGVEIRAGPGGSPTGGGWVTCLVSGGQNSSSMAWMAALSGFAIRLVHSRTDEAALRRVAGLYSELSFRMDATSLQLAILEGRESETFGRVGQWLRKHDETALAGLRPRGPSRDPPPRRSLPQPLSPPAARASRRNRRDLPLPRPGSSKGYERRSNDSRCARGERGILGALVRRRRG